MRSSQAWIKYVNIYFLPKKKSKKDATFMIICCLAWPLAEIGTRIYLVRILFGKEKKKKERKNVSQSGSSYAELFDVSEN